MSWKQTNIDKSTVFGAGSVSRVTQPYIVAGIRRNDPDMTNTNAYYPSLNGKTLIIEQGGDFSGTTTITFTSDAYYVAINTINTTSPSHLKAADYNGFLAIISQHPGNANYLKITGGTALSILGMESYPHPAAISYAGEIDSPKPSTFENRTKGTAVITLNEAVNRENWNRGLAAIGYVLDSFSANLDREIVFPVEYSVSITGTSFTISSQDRFYIAGASITSPNPSADILANLITITDSYGNLVFDSSGNRVRVSSVTYGTLVDATTSFSAWGTPDGKSVFGGSSHWQKTKATAAITSINGNTIKCTGATFISSGVQPNDTISISSATNTSPFSHNGEFYIDQVLSEEVLQVRPKGNSDSVLTSGNTPTCLNQFRNVGENYGSVTIYMGRFLPLSMPSSGMTFNLSSSLTGTYNVTLAVGKSLKSLLQEDLSASTVGIPNGGQIELGSKLITTLANALKPRIISKPNGDTTKTLLAEFKNGAIGTRIYTLLAGGVEIAYNGLWNGTSYAQEDGTKDTVIMGETLASVFLGTSNVSLTIDWANKNVSLGTSTNQFSINNTAGTTTAKMVNDFIVSDGTNNVLTVPKFDGTSASQSILKAGLKLGTGYTTDTQFLIEQVNYNCDTTSGKYTLLSETSLSAGRKRDYVSADGTSFSTINAKWNGTQWIKDTTIQFVSGKLVWDSSIADYKLYKHTSNTTPFADTAWTNERIPYSFSDLGDAVFNNTKQIFLEEFTALDQSKYQFSSTISSNSSFGSTQSSADTGHFGAGKWILTALSSTWNLLGSAGYLYIGTADFVLRYKFKLKDKSVLRTSAHSTLLGVNLGTLTTLCIGASSDAANFTYYWDLASADTGVAVQNDVWYIIEWQRFSGKMYLTIDDGTTKTTVINGTTDSVNRTFSPGYDIEAESYTGSFPKDVFLIDYFNCYR